MAGFRGRGWKEIVEPNHSQYDTWANNPTMNMIVSLYINTKGIGKHKLQRQGLPHLWPKNTAW
jgi:hypothetical protein